MRVKIFYKQADDMVFEGEINRWLDANTDIGVTHIAQSHAFAFETDDLPARNDYELIISVWYRYK